MTRKKTVFVSGSFNIIHPGHLRLLKFARELGDKLVVGVISDKIGGEAVHVPEGLRLEGVLANTWVNEAFIVDVPIADLIRVLKPDIVVKGKEHELKKNEEKNVLETYGGRLVFSSGENSFSSIDLIRKSILETKNLDFHIPSEYMERHNISYENLNKLVSRFAGLSVCVIGDLIVDEYIDCEPLGMSQEDPTIVVKPIDSSRFIGGAGIVAAHLAGLGAKVDFLTVVGEDEFGRWATLSLKGYGVKPRLFLDEARPTTQKTRYRAGGKTLLRVSKLHRESISIDIQKKIVQSFKKNINKYELLIFSDFNYGCLPQDCINQIIQIAKEFNLLMLADSQCSSQIGDISRFLNMDVLLPTEHEARISLRNQDDGLVVISERLMSKSKSKNIILKLGMEGLLLHTKNENNNPETDRLAAINKNPLDVSGAGDSMLASVGLVLACHGGIWEAALLGSIAAAIQVGRVGNIPLSASELTSLIDRLASNNVQKN